MVKYCPRCGAPNEDKAQFCAKHVNSHFATILFIIAILMISLIPISEGANITLSSSGYTETTITLYWTESNDLVFYNYTIYYAMNVNGPWYPIQNITQRNVTSTFFWGFQPSTTYYFYLEDNAWLSSTPSNTISVTTAPNPSLSITNKGETTVSLSWTDENVYTSLVPFDSYTILMGTNSGSLSVITTINNPSQNSYTVTGLSPGTTYYFQLYDTVGPQGVYTNSSYSNIVQTTTIAPLKISITSSSTTTDVNQPVTLSANVAGGISPYTYQWYVNGNPVSGANSPSFSFTSTNSGTYNIYASVTDSSGSSQNSNTITINVNPPLIISIATSTNTIITNQTIIINATVSSGTPPYTYQWYVNGNPVSGATSPSFSFTPNKAGSYSISVTITDSAGVSKNSNTLTINVNNPPIYSPSNSSFLFFIIIIVLVIIILLVVTFSLKKKKNK